MLDDSSSLKSIHIIRIYSKRLNSALDKFSYNSGKDDLLKFDVAGLGKSYAGAMVDGYGCIGDVAEVTLDDGTKFNFMILDTKSTKHKKFRTFTK